MTGKVVGCAAIASNAVPAVNTRLCELLTERGRFRPALLADGSPVASSYTSRILWLGDDEPRVSLSSWSRTATYEVDSEGRLVTCDVRDVGGDPGQPLFMCDVPYRYDGTWQSHPPSRQKRKFIRRVSVVVEGAPPLPVAGPAPDGFVIHSDSFSFDVRTDGSIPQCKQRCSLELRYLPQPHRARAVRTETIWLVEGGID